MTHHALCAALLPTGALCAKSSPFFRVRLPRSNSSVHARRVTIERTAVYKDCKLLYQSLASASAPHLATATDKLSLCLIIITPNDLHANMSSESASLYSTTSTVPVSLYSVSSKTLLKSEEAPSPRQSSSSKVSQLVSFCSNLPPDPNPDRMLALPVTLAPGQDLPQVCQQHAGPPAPDSRRNLPRDHEHQRQFWRSSSQGKLPAHSLLFFSKAPTDYVPVLAQAWMYHSEWEEKRAVPTKKTAKKLKSTSPRAPLRTSQETADEIMRLNATHGHPSVKVCALFTAEKRVTVADFLHSSSLFSRLISPASNKPASPPFGLSSYYTVLSSEQSAVSDNVLGTFHDPVRLCPIDLDRPTSASVRHLASSDA